MKTSICESYFQNHYFLYMMTFSTLFFSFIYTCIYPLLVILLLMILSMMAVWANSICLYCGNEIYLQVSRYHARIIDDEVAY